MVDLRGFFVVISLTALTVASCADLLGIEEGTSFEGTGGAHQGGAHQGGAQQGGSGGSGSGGAGGQRLADLPCGSVSQVVDDFSGTVLGRRWRVFDFANASAGLDGGAFVVEIPDGVASDGFLHTHAAYALTNGAVTFRLGPGTEIGSAASARLGLITQDGLHMARFELTGSGIRAEVTGAAYAEQPYPEGTLEALRIRDDEGIMYLEMQVAGGSWEQLAEAIRTTVFPDDLARVSMHVTSGGSTGITRVELEAMEDQNQGIVPNCPVSTLRDPFDDGVPGPNWGRSTAPGATCSFGEDSGKLTLTATGLTASAAYCAYGSSMDYELDDAGIVFHLESATISAGGQFVLNLHASDNEYVTARVTETAVQLRTQIGATNTLHAEDATSAATPIWIKVAASGDDVALSQSIDGLNFAPVGTVLFNPGTSALRVNLGASATAAAMTTAVVQQLNNP